MKCFRSITVLAALCAVLSGCTLVNVNIKPKIEVSSYFEKTIKLDQSPELYFKADSSNVEVYTWDKDEIKLEIKNRIRGILEKSLLEKKLKDFEFSFETEGNKVTLKSDYKGSIRNPADICADLRMYVPKKTRFMSYELDAGTIRILDDIKGVLVMDIDTANTWINRFEGIVDIKARMGNVNIEGGRISGESKVVAGMGNISIKAEFDENGKYVFETGLGNVDLKLPSDSRIGFETTGPVGVNAFESPDNPVRAKARSDMGKITITAY